MNKNAVQGRFCASKHDTPNCHAELVSASTPLVTTQNKEKILKRVQDDNRGGFTLIELLVVVLIIGILTAVAVPQYQKAVLKTRLVQTITACDALFKASRMYWLANGKWPTSFAPLDIEMPGTLNNTKTTVTGEYFKCDYTSSTPSIMCYVMRNGKELNFGIRAFFDTRGRRFCFAPADDAQCDQICKTVSGSSTNTNIGSSDLKYYLIR